MMSKILSPTDPDKLRAFAIEAAQLMHDRHCTDVRLLDVRGLSQVCDYVLIGSGTSGRQIRSVAQDLSELGESRDNGVFRTNADEAATWVVVDFVDLVAHLFEPNQRAYYDLEYLWSDAETVPWRRPGQEDQPPEPVDAAEGADQQTDS
jgi:ribosome-associated protein